MRHVALIACIAITGSVADAKPRKHKRKHHVAPVAETQPEPEPVPEPVAEPVAEPEPEPVRDVEVEVREAPPPVHAVKRRRDWHLAIGPYLWASSVDANVSLGSETVSTGVDFLQTTRHARYGVELQGELRYGDWSLAGDFMYGVVSLSGGTDVGPLMVSLGGEASSLLVDGMAGYTLAGDDDSRLSLEVRGGVRYQRTEVTAAVDVSGSPVMVPAIVDAARDAIAGARLFVRPTSWLFLVGTGDMGVFGTSTSTWSAAVDAGVHIGSHVVTSIGWRTLEIAGSQVSMTMHGPRVAVQVVF